MEYLKIKNFNKYQHYSDGRNMIWIKWHIHCLSDYEFSKLTNSTKWVFVGLICLACKCENKIPKDYEWIARQISTHGEPIDDEMSYLFDSKMVQDCTKMVQNDCLDKIREDKIREEENREDSSPIKTVVNHYKTKTKYHIEDKAWDKAHFPRCSISAKKLIDFCGSPELAIACIDGVASEMISKKLDWTIETIVKHSAKWKLEYEEKREQELKKQEETEKAEKFAQTMGVQ